MPIIYSGRLTDQTYSAMYNRLVRASNRARDEFPAGVNPNVKQILDGLHREGLLSDVLALYLPDMYAADSARRIGSMGGLTALGAATQGTEASKPLLSRADGRENLVLQSILPGTLGAASPDGWSSTDAGTGSAAGDLVASDDPSDGHQAWEVPQLDGDRRYLTQDVEVISGARLIFAAKLEANGYVSGGESIWAAGGGGTVVNSYQPANAAAGEWIYLSFNIDSGGSLECRVGAGVTSAVTMDAPLRFSRPCLLYMPPGWDGWSEQERQQYLTDHYAASGGDHQELPGFRGMRVVSRGDAQSLGASGVPNPAALGEFTMFALTIPRAAAAGNRLLSWDDNPVRSILCDSVNDRYRLWMRDADQNNVLASTPSGTYSERINRPTFVSGVVKIGEQLRIYINDSSYAGPTVPSLSSFGGPYTLGSSAGGAEDIVAAGLITRALDAAENEALDAVLRGGGS